MFIHIVVHELLCFPSFCWSVSILLCVLMWQDMCNHLPPTTTKDYPLLWSSLIFCLVSIQWFLLQLKTYSVFSTVLLLHLTPSMPLNVSKGLCILPFLFPSGQVNMSCCLHFSIISWHMFPFIMEPFLTRTNFWFVIGLVCWFSGEPICCLISMDHCHCKCFVLQGEIFSCFNTITQNKKNT